MDPAQVEKIVAAKLKETADLVETGLADIKKGMATKAELLEMITERTAGDKELIEATRVDVDKLNTGAAEAEAAMADLQKKIQQIRRSSTAELFPGSAYSGKFSSPQEAKTFALLVIAWTAGWGASASIGGMLIERSSYTIPFFTTSVLYLLSTILIFTFFVRKKKTNPDVHPSPAQQ